MYIFNNFSLIVTKYFMRIFELEADNKARDFARQVHRKLVKTLSTFSVLNSGTIEANNINKELITYPVAYLTMKQLGIDCGDLAIGVGKLKGVAALLDLRNKKNTLNCDFVMVFSSEEQTPAALLKIIKQNDSWFLHEFIHYIDFSKNKFTASAKSLHSAGDEGYYNSPHEMRAYYNEAIHKLEQRKDFKDIMKKSYNDFMHDVIGLFQQSFIRNLTQENEKRIAKRLYMFWKSYKNNGGF